MSVPRVRVSQGNWQSGAILYPWGENRRYYRTPIERCEDVTHNGRADGEHFLLQRYVAKGGILTGSATDGFATIIYDNYPSYILSWEILRNLWGNSGSPSPGEAVTKASGDLNPNAPDMDLPVSLSELRELPSMVRTAGNSFLKLYSQAIVAKEFGFNPLVSDLKSLFQFTKLVEKRKKALNDLSKGEYKRSASAGSYTSTSEFWTNADQHIGWRRMRLTTTEKVWVHARYRPTVALPLSDFERQQLAIRLVFGETIDMATLWNAIPWTWLIDWFTNIGDYLETYRNIVPVENYGGYMVMYHRTDRCQCVEPEYRSDDYPDRKYVDIETYMEQKYRCTVGSPTLNAHLPFLDGRQLSILGGISVLRSKRIK